MNDEFFSVVLQLGPINWMPAKDSRGSFFCIRTCVELCSFTNTPLFLTLKSRTTGSTISGASARLGCHPERRTALALSLFLGGWFGYAAQRRMSSRLSISTHHIRREALSALGTGIGTRSRLPSPTHHQHSMTDTDSFAAFMRNTDASVRDSFHKLVRHRDSSPLR